jgi:hypothetical protein
MSSRPIQPLYTHEPWSPSNFGPRKQDLPALNPYPDPTLIFPVDYQFQQLIPTTDTNTFTTPLQLDSSFVSPLTPGLVAPAPTPEVMSAYSNQNQITYPQYPTQSPWSTTSSHQQLLTPQYPCFPSTIFAYPQPSQPQKFSYPQHDTNALLPHYPINIHTQSQQNGNATGDLCLNNSAFAFAYSTSFDTTTHQHDMFQPYQHEALAPNNANVATEEMVHGYKVGWDASGSHLHSNPRVINQSNPIPQLSIDTIDANPINVDHTSQNPKTNIFRSDPMTSPKRAMPTIDPKLSSWGNMIVGGDKHGEGAGEHETMNDPENDRISAIPVPIINPSSSTPPPSGYAASMDRELGRGNDENEIEDGLDNISPTKRGRWSSPSSLSSRRPTTTPLRKRRPPQLHLPPPSSTMRIPIAATHSAPAASFSLDLFIPSQTQRADTTSTVLQEPPKTIGWVSPDERPVPPLGYTVPGSESRPRIFEYDAQAGHLPVIPVVPVVPVSQVDVEVGINQTVDIIPPPRPPVFQPYEPKSIPRVTADPQLRVPSTSPPSPPAPYIIVPGVNGFEVAYWRPQLGTHTRYPDPGFVSSSIPIPIQPPTTAAPWEVSVPPMDPSLPPSTASSWESISTLDGHFIPQSEEIESVVYLNHELRNRGKTKIEHPPRFYPRPQEKKESWAICEVCKATISRTSDLQVSSCVFSFGYS